MTATQAPHGIVVTDQVIPLPGEGATPGTKVIPQGQRLATALQLIRRGGATFGIGQKVPVDVVALTDLLALGAVGEPGARRHRHQLGRLNASLAPKRNRPP